MVTTNSTRGGSFTNLRCHDRSSPIGLRTCECPDLDAHSLMEGITLLDNVLLSLQVHDVFGLDFLEAFIYLLAPEHKFIFWLRCTNLSSGAGAHFYLMAPAHNFINWLTMHS